jgi:hypothetical protein
MGDISASTRTLPSTLYTQHRHSHLQVDNNSKKMESSFNKLSLTNNNSNGNSSSSGSTTSNANNKTSNSNNNTGSTQPPAHQYYSTATTASSLNESPSSSKVSSSSSSTASIHDHDHPTSANDLHDVDALGAVPEGTDSSNSSASSSPFRYDNAPNSILLVSVLNQLLPVSIDNLNTIFQVYGNVLRIVTFRKTTFQALVEFHTLQQAILARQALEGKDVCIMYRVSCITYCFTVTRIALLCFVNMYLLVKTLVSESTEVLEALPFVLPILSYPFICLHEFHCCVLFLLLFLSCYFVSRCLQIATHYAYPTVN